MLEEASALDYCESLAGSFMPDFEIKGMSLECDFDFTITCSIYTNTLG